MSIASQKVILHTNQSTKYSTTKGVNISLEIIIRIGRCTSRKSRRIQEKERRPLGFSSWYRLHGLGPKIHAMQKDRPVSAGCPTALASTNQQIASPSPKCSNSGQSSGRRGQWKVELPDNLPPMRIPSSFLYPL